MQRVEQGLSNHSHFMGMYKTSGAYKMLSSTAKQTRPFVLVGLWRESVTNRGDCSNTTKRIRRRSASRCSLESAPRSGTIPLSSRALLLSRRCCWSRLHRDRSAREGNRRLHGLGIAACSPFRNITDDMKPQQTL